MVWMLSYGPSNVTLSGPSDFMGDIWDPCWWPGYISQARQAIETRFELFEKLRHQDFIMISFLPPSFYDTKREGTEDGDVFCPFLAEVRRAFRRGVDRSRGDPVTEQCPPPPPEVSTFLPSFLTPLPSQPFYPSFPSFPLSDTSKAVIRFQERTLNFLEKPGSP